MDLNSRGERSGFAVAGRADSANAIRLDAPLSVTIVFTTREGTLNALRLARRFASGLNGSIRVLIPQVVPYPLPLDRPPVNPQFRIRRFCSIAGRVCGAVRFEVLLCRDAQGAMLDALVPESLVIVGHTSRWWRRWNKVEVLIRSLRRRGHQVITTS